MNLYGKSVLRMAVTPLVLVLLIVGLLALVGCEGRPESNNDGPLAMAIVREWLAARPSITANSTQDCLGNHVSMSKEEFSARIISPGVVEVTHVTELGKYFWLVYVKEKVVNPTQRPKGAGIC